MTKKKTKRILKKVLVFLLFTSGLCLSLYPTVADIYGKSSLSANVYKNILASFYPHK